MKYAFFAPECLQLSSIDCGVAAVSVLLSGYGVDINYEDLRESCQTGVDGTSIDSLEDLCNGLGLDVVQHIVPSDLAIDVMDGRYPLIAVFRGAGGIPHFVTVWRRIGAYFQLMDPVAGRRWVHGTQLVRQLHIHTLRLSQQDWRLWMADNSYREALKRRARKLLNAKWSQRVSDEFLSRLHPSEIATVDAALRLLDKGKRRIDRPTARRNSNLFEQALRVLCRRETPANTLMAIESTDDEVSTSGVVLLAPAERHSGRARPKKNEPLSFAVNPARSMSPTARLSTEGDGVGMAEGMGETRNNLTDKRGLLGELYALLGTETRTLTYALALGAFVLAIATTAELLIFRVAVDATRLFTTFESKYAAAALFIGLGVMLLATEGAVAYGRLSLGRHAELKLRLRTLYALPRVTDQFIRSRPITDLAYRAHNLAIAAQLPGSILIVVRALCDILLTCIAIGWLGWAYLPPVLIGCVLLGCSYMLTRNRLRELDTRNQIHASRLLTLFRDTLRGSRPIRVHGYQDSFRDDHQSEISQWRTTRKSLIRALALLESTNGFAAAVLVVSVFFVFITHNGDARVFVLLAFWVFRLPPLVRAIVLFAQEYPIQSVALQRILEVTRQRSGQSAAAVRLEQSEVNEGSGERASGVAVSFRSVSVVLNQCPVLYRISLELSPGEHVAIVGHSGSGKSSLAAVLLGFVTATEGEVLADSTPFDAQARSRLLRETVWIDPSNQLWDTSLRDNCDYAVDGLMRRPFLETIELSDLLGVLNYLERGLDTRVGPDGNRLSGGEGQRLRVARGVRRAEVRLVILDEAFRGLERDIREKLTSNVRAIFPHATLLSISHDIRSALEFPRVLVMAQGEIVEQGAPESLAQQPTHFRRLLLAEEHALHELWSPHAWRQVQVTAGRVVEGAGYGQ